MRYGKDVKVLRRRVTFNAMDLVALARQALRDDPIVKGVIGDPCLHAYEWSRDDEEISLTFTLERDEATDE